VLPDAGLQLEKEAVVPARKDVAVLRRQPFGVGLRGAAVRFARAGVDRAVGNDVRVVKGLAALKNEAVGSAAKRQGGRLDVGDLPGYRLVSLTLFNKKRASER
jgi:hypothetical protein